MACLNESTCAISPSVRCPLGDHIFFAYRARGGVGCLCAVLLTPRPTPLRDGALERGEAVP